MRLLLLVATGVVALAIAFFGWRVLQNMEKTGRRGIRGMLPLIIVVVILILAASGTSFIAIVNNPDIQRVDLRARATALAEGTEFAPLDEIQPTPINATRIPPTDEPFPMTATTLVAEATATEQTEAMPSATTIPSVAPADDIPLLPPVLTATQMVAEAEQTISAARVQALTPTATPRAAQNDPFVLTAIALVEQVTQQAGGDDNNVDVDADADEDPFVLTATTIVEEAASPDDATEETD